MNVEDSKELYDAFTRASQTLGKNAFSFFADSADENKDLFSLFTDMASKIVSEPETIVELQSKYLDFLRKKTELWGSFLDRQAGKITVPVVVPSAQDKRFKAPEWSQALYFDYIKQNYLLVNELYDSVVNSVDLDEKTKKKLSFYTRQYLDAMAPSNFFATNPEAIKQTNASNGESVLTGFKNMLNDMAKGEITQTETSAFELGKNLAATPGSVIFENELIQLIQYRPTTKKVHKIPLLIIPPWINKYYILDLRPENSFVKYIVDQGYTTFMVSWKNPNSSMREIGFEEYIELGSAKAIQVVQDITKSKKINALGYCLGGTLLSMTLAIACAKKEVPVQSATFLAAMVDFSDIGPMGDIVDEALINKLEKGEIKEYGMMRGKVMMHAFNAIRANDLIWGYVANNYLMGKKPEAFDILYWNGDSTNLPARMYMYYLRHIIFENKLSRKNALRIGGISIDISKIDLPAFVIGTNEDHISPAVTTFTTTELLSGPVEYVLGGSGHVMGIVNPPARKKYYYLAQGKADHGFDEWKKTSKQFEGSWWPTWIKWLTKHSGPLATAPKKPGSAKYKIIEPAPGRYVKERC